MKRNLVLACAFVFAGSAVAQESEVTEEVTEETTVETRVSTGVDLMSPLLWNIHDATPTETHTIDLQLGVRWVTSSHPANRGDSDDDTVIQPMILWGPCENVELSLGIPIWLGDGGKVPGGFDGNADINVGLLWRVTEQQDYWPAFALAGNIRTPSGDNSSGADGEIRLIFTNEYDSGIRSHINGFFETVNGDNVEDERHFQWGVLVGLDGPLCADGAVRWVTDYMHRSSYHYGASDINMLELGWEWQMAEAHKLGMSMRIGLDDNEDTDNFSMGFAYAYSIMY
jgi:hypothetical protein